MNWKMTAITSTRSIAFGVAVLLATATGIPAANAASMVEFGLRLQAKALVQQRIEQRLKEIRKRRDEAAGRYDRTMNNATNRMNEAAAGGPATSCRYYGC